MQVSRDYDAHEPAERRQPSVVEHGSGESTMKPERIQLVADENPPWTHVEAIRAVSREMRFPSSDIADRFAAYAEAVGKHHGFQVQAVETDGRLLLLVFAGMPRTTSVGTTAGEDDLRACLRLLSLETDSYASSTAPRRAAG